MSIEQQDFFTGFIRVCSDGWEQGWHERNGGNLTYRLTAAEAESIREELHPEDTWHDLDVQAENLAGEYFLVTGSGKFMRNVPLAPEKNICVIRLDETGSRWQKVWGLTEGGNPTSELSSHILNQSARIAAGDDCRVIYHAHPVNITAMTYILPISDRVFTRILWQSETECAAVFPEGVAVLPWMIPGKRDIALATSEKMKDFRAVVWAQHGMFAAGPDFDTTFGLFHTIEKAAQIYMTIRATGAPIINTISDGALRQIADAFGVKLREDFL